MKLAIYEVREDEKDCLAQMGTRLGVELVTSPLACTPETLQVAKGCQGVSTLGRSRMEEPMLRRLKQNGVQAVSTRTIGTNHINLKAAKDLGISVCNAAYGPESVADYTVMLLLLLLRNYKPALWRQQVNDYSLDGLIGCQLRSLTVGVVGTGRIGLQVMKDLSGFGCRLIASDPYPSEAAAQYAEYMPFEQLLAEADCITLHAPLTEENVHMINEDTISKMKDGVVLLNCARGELMDIDAVIHAVENKKIGRLGLDVIEKEEGIYHEDRKNDILKNRRMAYLRQFPNVVMTQHMAFYTQEAVVSMVEMGVGGLVQMIEHEKCRCQLV